MSRMSNMRQMMIDEMKDTAEGKSFASWSQQVEMLEQLLEQAKEQKYEAWETLANAFDAKLSNEQNA